MKLKKTDKRIFDLTIEELRRQQENLVMIPSENYASQGVLEALGTPFTNKYAEGEPGRRYYQGNEFTDQVERLAVSRSLKVFGLSKREWHANVKAISASYANLAVMTALLEPGQKIMVMNLPDGGHLSHGWDLSDGRKVTLSSKLFKIKRYRVDKETELFEYDKIENQAKRFRPHLLISGGTAYARQVNHRRMAAIAHKVNGYYLADVAHEAGLVAGGANKSPFPFADVVTMSTQKTLRGPRGSIIICRKELASKIDRAIFPGLQGGPFMNNIAAIAVALKEAQSSKFREYAIQTVINAKILASSLKRQGFQVVSGGTDKHLILINLCDKKLDGKTAAAALESAGIVVNKNTVPGETGTPVTPSGIRLGTPALTTRGMKETEMKQIAKWIAQILEKPTDKRLQKRIKKEVKQLTEQFPIYENLGWQENSERN